MTFNMNTSPADFIKKLKSESVNYVAFCFTDINGKFNKITYHINGLSESLFEDGIIFDGSSLKGWKSIHKSDCLLIPDLSSAFLDPFTTQPCYSVICDAFDPETKSRYQRDPRTIAQLAEKYALDKKFGDEIFFGPEMEFFIFDDVRFQVESNNVSFTVNSEEGGYNNSSNDKVNLGHRPDHKGGYLPAQPVDSLFDIRAEICSSMDSIGMHPTLHHHEVAAGQCEIGFKYNTLTKSADNIQKFKYLAKNVVMSFGKTATFMPKPIYGDNGSGMHTHISIWEKGNNIFYHKDGYASLSDSALYFIGGIIKHAKAINAFTNPTTNSYKRLVPGFEAPVNLAYSSCNRSASIRIPHSSGSSAKRIEIRFPDPPCNPYIGIEAMLMAGLDGIENKIYPGEAIDKDLYNLDEDKNLSVSSVCGSLNEALNNLNTNRDFLKKGNVFTDDFIDTYIRLKSKDVIELDTTPHPVEFKLYYSC